MGPGRLGGSGSLTQHSGWGVFSYKNENPDMILTIQSNLISRLDGKENINISARRQNEGLAMEVAGSLSHKALGVAA